jgi:hypothetical protein
MKIFERIYKTACLEWRRWKLFFVEMDPYHTLSPQTDQAPGR